MLKKIALNPFFVFPVLTCVYFWPVSLQVFTFKNDALTYYYPVRTLISDALHNFEIPFWTPFINMGYPLHADMQSGAWNPILWIFGFFTNYNLAAFHFELLVYLALGGIGFYYLSKEHGWNKPTAFIMAIAYEFCGPIIDSIQFTSVVSAACYIPFIFLFFRRLLHHQQPAVNALLTAFFLYLLFTGGYPALFIITLYLLAALLLFAFFSALNKAAFIKRIILPVLIISWVFILLSLPAIISFLNHIHFIDRGKQQNLDFVLDNSMPPTCMFSFISPFSTTAKSLFFDTDTLMRNIYIGIAPLIFLIYTVCSKAFRNKKVTRFYLITTLVLFGLAWGSHFFLRQLAYYILPLMDTFRHSALFRLFGVIFSLLTAGFAVDEWGKQSVNTAFLKKIILAIGTIVLLISLYIILLPATRLIPANFNFEHAQSLIPTLGFQQRFLIQFPFIITTLCILYLIVSKTKSQFYLLLLCMADLFFATQLNMPITVIGAKGFAATERQINRNRLRFPLPGNTTIEQNSRYSIDSTKAIGSTLPFEKKVGRNEYYITPGNLSLQEKFYTSPIKDRVFKNRLLYFADTILVAGTDLNVPALATPAFAIISAPVSSIISAVSNKGAIVIKKLSANTLECLVETTTPRLLVFLQNSYPGWEVFIDGNKTSVFTANISFMGVNIPAGKHEILFSYYPRLILYAWYVSLFTLSGLGLFLLQSIIRHRVLPHYHNQ